jgi:site-specific recombinase XerD
MIAAGVDLRTVSGRAGHASMTTTSNIYAHQIQSADARTAEKIGNILDPRHNEKKA